MPRMTFSWPDGKAGAVTTSWDDGTTFDRQLIQVLNKHGLKGTFNLNSAYLGFSAARSGWKDYVQPEEVATLYAGHEVACHTTHHPRPHWEPDEQMFAQVIEDRRALERLTGYPVRGMALPYVGTCDERVHARIAAAGIRYLRWMAPEPAYGPPGDFMHWQVTGHYGKFAEYWEKFSKDKSPEKLLYLWGHSYEFDRDRSWPTLESLAATVGSCQDLWLATNGQIHEYVTAWRSLCCSVEGTIVRNLSCLPVWYRVDGDLRKVGPGDVARVHG